MNNEEKVKPKQPSLGLRLFFTFKNVDIRSYTTKQFVLKQLIGHCTIGFNWPTGEHAFLFFFSVRIKCLDFERFISRK